jgi:hypothetical protein
LQGRVVETLLANGTSWFRIIFFAVITTCGTILARTSNRIEELAHDTDRSGGGALFDAFAKETYVTKIAS